MSYAELARRLDDELGLAPSPGSRRLEEDVLLQRSALDFVAPADGAGDARPPLVERAVHRPPGRARPARRAVPRDARGTAARRARGRVRPGSASRRWSRSTACASAPTASRRWSATATPIPRATTSRSPRSCGALVAGLDDPARVGAARACSGSCFPDLASNELAGELSDANAPGAHLQLFDAVATTLERLAASPIVLVVEDLHWADRPTLALLRYLLRHPRLDHLLVVATLRDDEFIGERAELIERLAPRANTTTLPLDGFGDHEVRALIRSAAPPETMPEIIDASVSLQEITGGNPYFLRELLRELDEEPEKHDGERDLARTLATIAPAGVRTLVDRRLDRLSDRGREVLEAAAVLGRDVSIDLLADMCDAVERDDLRCARGEPGGAAPRRGLRRRRAVSLPAHARRATPSTRRSIPTGGCSCTGARARRSSSRMSRARGAASTWRATSARPPVSAARGQGRGRARSRPATMPPPGSRSRKPRAGTSRRSGCAPTRRSTPHDTGRRAARPRPRVRERRPARVAPRETFLAAAEHARRRDDAALLADVALAADGPWSKGAEFSPVALPLLEEALLGIGDDAVRRVEILNGIASDLYYADPDREGELAAAGGRPRRASSTTRLRARPRSSRSTVGTRTSPKRVASASGSDPTRCGTSPRPADRARSSS